MHSNHTQDTAFQFQTHAEGDVILLCEVFIFEQK